MAVVHDFRRGRGWNLIKRIIRAILIVGGSLISIMTVLGLVFTLLGILNKFIFHSAFLAQVKEMADSYFEFILIPFFRIADWIGKRGESSNNLVTALVCVLAIAALFVTFRIGTLLRGLGRLIHVDSRGGDEGEKLALETVRGLPDAYHIFVNLEFELRGHHETDLIVVGSEGVCVCEVKYWKGKIYFSDTDRKSVMRVFPDGEMQNAHSPRDQVRAHYETLRDALRGEGVNTPVWGMVLMMYPGVEIVDAEYGSYIPVLKSPSAELIRAHLGNQRYSAREVDKIVAALKKIAL